MDVDSRQLAVYTARARVVAGAALLVAPGLVGRLWLGPGGASPVARALGRAVGIRDVVLGVGALTALRESDHGPEWVGMGAVGDGVDAAVSLFAPGLSWRARLVAPVIAVVAGFNLKLARDLDDARRAEIAVAPLAGA